MTMSPPNVPVQGNVNVATDETSIYENGVLRVIRVQDLLNNQVAISQLVNAHNLLYRERENLSAEVSSLKEVIATKTMQPLVAILLSVSNVFGVVLVGFGINYLSSQKVPPFASLVLWMGIILSAVPSILSPLMPTLTKTFKAKNSQ